MKPNFLLIILFCLSISGFTQPILSPFTQQYMYEVHTKGSADMHRLFKKTEGTKVYSGGLIKVTDAAKAQSSLNALSIQVGTKAGNIWTIQVPSDKITSLNTLQGISYIQLDEPARPDLYIARQSTRVDSVQKGIDLDMRISGKDVIVGVIDFGFDYTHPAFYDTTYSRYRIKRVWELNGTGTPPSGYTYGNEITDTALIKLQGTDNTQQTHGTCVAGIAAGSGYGSATNTRYRGMAYDADLVFVGVRRDSIAQQWMQGGFSDFVDGINYIFSYAQSVGKPAVVNISWGSQSGAHDGNSLFNQACNNLSGSGRIIVMSAGNEGQEKIHLTKSFTSTDTALYTFLDFAPPTYKRTWVDVWGDTAKTFCAEVTLYSNLTAGNSTGTVCLSNNMQHQILISNNGIDTCYVDFISSTAEANGKPRMTIAVFNKAPDSVSVKLSGTDGTIHAWNEYYYYGYTNGYLSSFDSYGQPWATTGDTISTTSDMGSGEQVILVGAYASKTDWKDLGNVSHSYAGYAKIGKMVPFSSHGPMIGGKVKPDIAAPGLTLGTAVSSHSTTYVPGGSNSQYLVAQYTEPVTNKKYYYSEFIGTSASAPAASGIVALMLQANPHLWPSQVHDILKQTAITDVLTGTLPPDGDNTWGHGKINAYAAVKMAIQRVGLYQYAGKKIDCVLYPNPAHGAFTIDINLDKEERIKMEMYSLTGKLLYQDSWKALAGTHREDFSMPSIEPGMYLIKLTSGDGSSIIRTWFE